MFPRQACIGAFAWFLLGYGFAYHNGKDGDTNAFIGTGPSNFALSGGDYDIDESNGSARPSLPPTLGSCHLKIWDELEPRTFLEPSP